MKIMKFVFSILLVLLFAVSCDVGPPRECDVEISDSADEELFSQYFSNMSLADEKGFEGIPHDEYGVVFDPSIPLVVSFNALKSGSIKFCVQSRSGSKFIPATRDAIFEAGSSSITISNFMDGSYVIRVIVEDTLVKNFSFGTE